MILTIILIGIIALLTIFVISACIAGGATMLIVFGDVIVCIALITWLIYRIIKRRRR